MSRAKFAATLMFLSGLLFFPQATARLFTVKSGSCVPRARTGKQMAYMGGRVIMDVSSLRQAKVCVRSSRNKKYAASRKVTPVWLA
jgi:hypothetical protein